MPHRSSKSSLIERVDRRDMDFGRLESEVPNMKASSSKNREAHLQPAPGGVVDVKKDNQEVGNVIPLPLPESASVVRKAKGRRWTRDSESKWKRRDLLPVVKPRESEDELSMRRCHTTAVKWPNIYTTLTSSLAGEEQLLRQPNEDGGGHTTTTYTPDAPLCGCRVGRSLAGVDGVHLYPRSGIKCDFGDD